MIGYQMYPALEPYRTSRLKVSDLHTLYYEESGNPNGQPIVFIHGGPGGGTSPEQRRFFDPKHYRIILFDQRGCGKSTPHAELRENTTWDLVADMERLRTELKIESWILFGGSWGSTLALAYAETHPARVRGLILRGIFLCRDRDLKWFYQYGASLIFPDEWEAYQNFIPVGEREDFIPAYYRRLTGEDSGVRLAAAKIWSGWEASTSKLLRDRQFIDHYVEDDFATAFARIEAHYFVNKCFFRTDNQLLEDAYKLSGIPTHIIHGRYDMVCPMDNAWELKKRLPHAELVIVPDNGHSAFEAGITRELVIATERFKSL